MDKLDNKDKQILNLLQQEYRISYSNLSEKLGMAKSTIHNRVQKMVENGIIRNFDTVVCPLKVGYEAVAIIGLSVEPEFLDIVSVKLAIFDEIQLVATSTGNYDIIVQIYAKDEKELWRFIKEKIRTIEGVKSNMDVSSFIDIIKMVHKINFSIDD